MSSSLQSLSLRNVIVLFWMLAIFSLPFPFVPFNSQVVIGIAVLSIVYFIKHGKRPLNYVGFHVAYLIPCIVSVLSLVFVSNEGPKVLEKEALTLIVPVVTFLLLNSDFQFTEKDYRRFLLSFVAAVGILIVYTTIRSFFYSDEFFAHEYITFDIIHPAYFSFYCGVAILIVVRLYGNDHRYRWFAGLVVVAILAYMTYLSARMSLFMTIVVLVPSILFMRPITVKRLVVYFVLFVTVFGSLLYMVKQSPRLEYRFLLVLGKNFNTRIVSWEAAWSVFTEHPLVGVGVGAEQVYLDQYYETKFPGQEDFIGFNAHNYWLHILMVYGVLGALLILVFWVVVVLKTLKVKERLLIQVLLLFLLCSCTEVMWARQKGIVFFYLFFSVHLLYKWKSNDSLKLSE